MRSTLGPHNRSARDTLRGVGSSDDDVSVAFVSTYPPRRCGIATFTADLRAGVTRSEVVALSTTPDDGGARHAATHHEIRTDEPTDFARVARALDGCGVDIVSVQHEYGIWGPSDGEGVLRFLDAISMPAVATLHTVLRRPSPSQSRIMRGILDATAAVVVMSQAAATILVDRYGADPARVKVIPHGVPDLPFVDPALGKPSLGHQGHQVLLSFGLLGPGKGYETVIEAMPAVVRAIPEARYVIVGATHPDLLRREGDRYREGLRSLAAEQGVSSHVEFVDRFVSSEELKQWLQAADVFVTPYPNLDQIVSGTLSYAMAAGKAIVSTPYLYAAELLSDGDGVLVHDPSASAMAVALIDVLTDPARRDHFAHRAYRRGRTMLWAHVAKEYRSLFARLHSSMRPAARLSIISRTPAPPYARTLQVPAPLPPPVRGHLDVMGTPFGIVQHAKGTRPDPTHGSCTDDVARALRVDLMHARELGWSAVERSVERNVHLLDEAFQASTGRFRNFRLLDGSWPALPDSEDADARALQALAETMADAPRGHVRGVAADLFERALPTASLVSHIRPQGTLLLACSAALRAGADGPAPVIYRRAADALWRSFAERPASSGWPWPEPLVTYENELPAMALIEAGRDLGRPEMVRTGLSVLEWLIDAQTASGYLSVVGNDGWWPMGGVPARFDQQAISATSMLLAAESAYEETRKSHYREVMELAYGWFTGHNVAAAPVAVVETGACRDGIGPAGVNENQGAESTLMWLMAVEHMRASRARRPVTATTELEPLASSA